MLIPERLVYLLFQKCRQESKENEEMTAKQMGLLAPNTPPPPPLLSINEIGKSSNKTPVSTTSAVASKMPKLQRLPRAGESGTNGSVSTTSTCPPMPQLFREQPVATNTVSRPSPIGTTTTTTTPTTTTVRSIVCTSSTTVVTTTSTTSGSIAPTKVPASQKIPIQTIVSIKGKKYIVVAKDGESVTASSTQNTSSHTVSTSSVNSSQMNGLKTGSFKPIQPRPTSGAPTITTPALVTQPSAVVGQSSQLGMNAPLLSANTSGAIMMKQPNTGSILLVPVSGPKKETNQQQFLILNNTCKIQSSNVLVNQSSLLKGSQSMQMQPAQRIQLSLPSTQIPQAVPTYTNVDNTSPMEDSSDNQEELEK